MAIDIQNAYEKSYKIRTFEGNFAVSVPPQVIRKEAKKNGMSIDEFIERFRLTAQYDNFEGLHYTFKERPKVAEDLEEVII